VQCGGLLGGNFVAWPCFVTASGWGSESSARGPFFFPLGFFL
jgi:hypothetical protein